MNFNLSFDNQFTASLPADTEARIYPRTVENAAFSFVLPKKTAQPSVVSINEALAVELGFSDVDVHDKLLAKILTGNVLLDGMKPYAMNYGGHQFGQWAGQLGDGRAINLGQITTETIGLQTLQLKGSGQTPYSRHADGLAVLRSSIREYLCSEAMFHLGIPTTRALSLCLSGDLVNRDMFYNGNPKDELGAIVCRVSSSFLRFGSFQLPAQRGELELLKQLVDFSIEHNFAHLGKPCKETYVLWFQEICQKTCELMIHWMRVGFVHGVMNTDNMSILSETIDYGPYGWIDNFDLRWTPNTTDAQGKRYCFGAQPEIAQWNLFQLGNAIYPLIKDAEPLNEALHQYVENYEQQWLDMMQAKVGFDVLIPDTDKPFFMQLERLLTEGNIDMTMFYRRLASVSADNMALDALFFRDCFYEPDMLDSPFKVSFDAWLNEYVQRLQLNETSDEMRQQQMNNVNPKYVLRNYLSQQAIELAEKGDYSMIYALEKVLRKPYSEQMEFDHFAQKRPEWAKHKAGCSMLSCSS